MKTKKTIYHLIVDKSGSMSDCIDRTIEGFNEQLKSIQRMCDQYPEQDIAIGLTMFNHQVQTLYHQTAPTVVKPLTVKNYCPDGTTALLDAIGMSVDQLMAAKNESERTIPTTVVVVVLTDGYENASVRYRLADIRSKIAELESTGQWTFSFIGATLDAAEVAEQMNIKRQNSYVFDKANMQSGVFSRLSANLDIYLDKKRKGGDLGNFIEK